MTSAEVAVVGAGPAGLIAASVLARAGVAVTLFEGRRSPGRKFLLAGRSGLNLTHSEPLDDLLDRYGSDRSAIEAAIRAFGPDDLRRWAAGLGTPTFVGSSGRVFPESMKATPLLRQWLSQLADAGVTLRTSHHWVGWTADGDELQFETDQGTACYQPRATILALGGASWPRVSSDASWTGHLAGRGVAIEPMQASNCGLRIGWTSIMREQFNGTPVKNVAVRTSGTPGPGDMVRGDIVVTDDGLEGGPIYAQARAVRSEIAASRIPTIEIDLQPDLSLQALTTRLSNRRPKATVSSWLRSARLDPVAIGLLREATGNAVPNTAVEAAALIKAVRLNVTGLASIDKAISSAGGVALDGLDDHFMLTELPGVFAAGEMLAWDAPTGGYLLQACFSTGVAAANGVVEWLARSGSD